MAALPRPWPWPWTVARRGPWVPPPTTTAEDRRRPPAEQPRVLTCTKVNRTDIEPSRVRNLSDPEKKQNMELSKVMQPPHEAAVFIQSGRGIGIRVRSDAWSSRPQNV